MAKRNKDVNRASDVSGFGCFPLELLGLCACRLDGDGCILVANSKCKDFWGHEVADLVGKHYDELLCPDGNGGDSRGFAALIGVGGSDKFFESSYRTRDGSLVWGLVIVSPLASPGEGEPSYLMVVDDITKQRSVHENRDWNLKLNRALARLHEPLVDSEASIMSVAEIIYEETRNITECKYGYVGSVNPVTGDLVVHTFSKLFDKGCKVDPEGVKVAFPHDGDGHYPSLWGHSLNTGVPFYANDSMHHEFSKGIPKGHVDLKNYLSVPLFLKEELVGQIGLANKDGGFSDRDLEAVREFGKLFVLAISRIRDKEKIEESEARFRDLVELMQEGILADDVDGRVTYVNHRFCNMLGVSRGDLMGSFIKSFVLKDDQGWYQQQRELRKEGLLDNYELTFLHKDGHKIFTLVSPTPLFNERAEYLGSFGVVTDITKLKGLESQLLQAQKLESIGQLAAGIAHEINTPAQYVDNNIRFLKTSMEAMLGIVERCAEFVEALKTGTSREDLLYMADMVMDVDELILLKEDIPEAVADSLVGLDRISEIVKSVKQLAHPGMKGKVFADINEAVRSTVTVSSNEWRYVADLDVDLDENLPKVSCFVGELNQVFLNLIINAVDAIKDKIGEAPKEKGHIGISTAKKGSCVEIRVSDSGGGVPAAVADKIFDPFFTTKQVGRGTGQGLAISHGVIVEKHGGMLSFTTEEGVGTTFIISLPIEENEGRECQM